MPAEALPAHQHDQLVAELHGHGLTDTQIAERTRWSGYVVGRIRSRLGLSPNTGDRHRARKRAGGA